MIRLLQWLFHGCCHEWVVTKEVKPVSEDGNYYSALYTLQCKKCGDIKRKQVMY